MQIDGQQIPEPFNKALAEGRAAEVVEQAVASPAGQFARGLARICVGRYDDARRDFEAARTDDPAIAAACQLELAFLDIRQRANLKGALATASGIAETAANPGVAGRAWHIVGLAEGKLRNTPAAVDALRKGEDAFRAAGDARGRAQVRQTLGDVEAARGRLDYAVQCYALSLADKALTHDREGMAYALGALGRVHLRAGRYADALDCFTRDLELAGQLGDKNAIGRMHEDIGRTLLAQGELEQAQAELQLAWQLAEAGSSRDLAFFAQKDLALLHIARGDLLSAAAALALAGERMPAGGEQYFQLIWEATQAELLAARGDPTAAEWLERAVQGFEKAELPDLEVPARLSLARVWIKAGKKSAAERCLRAAMRMARCDGYTRYLARLNEAMMELGVVEGALEETGRDVTSQSPTMHSYVIRARLGSGAFGEVFHVYDPERNDDFALKRLHLDEIYDPHRRKDLLDSAYCELEAGSRVRHPGVARVWAIGTEPDGSLYVVQELVVGHSLAADMPGDASAPLALVLGNLVLLAGALEALHAAHVIHRDLKPANVLMRPVRKPPKAEAPTETYPADRRAAAFAWQPVLVDFGIAHIQGSEHADPERLAGTLPYMAPEQAMGERLDARADLYALGVIAYEWLSGTRPLDLRGSTFVERARDLAKRKPPAVSQFRPDVPREVEQLVMQLLEKKAKHRPPSAAAVAERLSLLLPAAELAGSSLRT